MPRLITIFFLFMQLGGYSQQILKGVVLDQENGDPVAYASISIVGTSKGTSSNKEGQFSIIILQDRLIKITCIGYESKIIQGSDSITTIYLTPTSSKLTDIYIYNRPVNPTRIVRRAFDSIHKNYNTQTFSQEFFYRHYCKDDTIFGRLIEAFIEVRREGGYRPRRDMAGQKEEIQVSHIRRSFDKTALAQGHVPISIGSILQADVAAYQTTTSSRYLKAFEEISDLKIDLENYEFSFDGIRSYDSSEVYKIDYRRKLDSVLTTSGYREAPKAQGTLYIDTQDFAIVSAEDNRMYDITSLKSSIQYEKIGPVYYAKHLVREGESKLTSTKTHTFHVEMVAIDIDRNTMLTPLKGQPVTAQTLSQIPYDSIFWNTSNMLVPTSLEIKIIRDLGGGKSLESQFRQYQKFEWATTMGGENGMQKYQWLLQDSKRNRPLFIGYFGSDLKEHLRELELFKQLSKKYRGKVTFVIILLESNNSLWLQRVSDFNLFVEGIVNYRIEPQDQVDELSLKESPAFYMFPKNGDGFKVWSLTDTRLLTELELHFK
jgi:hypothetical protein